MTPFTGQIVDANGRVLIKRVKGHYHETTSQPSGYLTVEPPFDGDGPWMFSGIIRMDNGLTAEAFATHVNTDGVTFQFANGLPK